jgi:hypothetical protein
MDKPEKLATQGTQGVEIQSKNTTEYVLNTTIRQQTQTTQIRHGPSHKQDMVPPTNKTWSLPQTRHGPSHKQDMVPPTNKTWSLPQITAIKDEPSIVFMRKSKRTSQHGSRNAKTHNRTTQKLKR